MPHNLGGFARETCQNEFLKLIVYSEHCYIDINGFSIGNVRTVTFILLNGLKYGVENDLRQTIMLRSAKLVNSCTFHNTLTSSYTQNAQQWH